MKRPTTEKTFIFISGVFLLTYQSGTGQNLIDDFLNPVPITETFYVYAHTENFNPGDSGTGVTWNFNSLSDSVFFSERDLYPNLTTYFQIFPNTNVATTADDSSFTYSLCINSDWMILGFGSPDFTLVYTDPQILFHYPFWWQFNNLMSDIYAGTYTYAGMEVRRTGFVNSEVDGEGVLILPSIQENNVIRVKYTDSYIDSFFIAGSYILSLQTVAKTYFWISDSPDRILISAKTITTGDGSSVTSKEIVKCIAAGSYIREFGDVSVHIGFNKAQGSLFMKSDLLIKEFGLDLSDITGRLIYGCPVERLSGASYQKNILIPDVPPGLYIATGVINGLSYAQKLFIY